MNILPTLTVLLLCQLAGTVIQQFFGLPVPGAVIGMVMLFTYFVIRGRIAPEMQQTALGLLRYMPLLFIPAGVGVMSQVEIVRREWLPISVAIVVSAVVTMAFTGILMQALLRHSTQKPPPSQPSGVDHG